MRNRPSACSILRCSFVRRSATCMRASHSATSAAASLRTNIGPAIVRSYSALAAAMASCRHVRREPLLSGTHARQERSRHLLSEAPAPRPPPGGLWHQLPLACNYSPRRPPLDRVLAGRRSSRRADSVGPGPTASSSGTGVGLGHRLLEFPCRDVLLIQGTLDRRHRSF